MSQSSSLVRNRFFDGQLLTAEDFSREQEYFLKKLKRHNRSLHGFGIVSGLKVSIVGGEVVVDSGLALDCEGNEIVIETPQRLPPPPSSNECARTAFISIRYVEANTDPVPVHGPHETPGGHFVTVTETFELGFDLENWNRGHKHLRSRWLACGQPHSLTLAKLRQHSQGWRVDRSYRPPVIK